MHFFLSKHLETTCPSCMKIHSGKWKSEWWHHDHYCRLDCNCGYKVNFKTGHFHSGLNWHDN